MFKIDPKPTTIQDGETKVCLSNIHSIAHPYNLPNHAIIDSQGEVLSDCSQQKHEEDFAYHLLEGMLSGQQRRLPAHEIGKYLSYHYQHTPPEERTAFCDWLKYTLPSYNQYFNVDLGRLQAITDWLDKSKHKGETPDSRKYPEKWYALYYRITLWIGQPDDLKGESKKNIIAYGKKRFSTGQGFYNALKDYMRNEIGTIVRSMGDKDRKKWQQIIKDISNYDADVISWLKNKPE